MDLPPSLRCLRAFEAVARHRNVTLAAKELGVSQPAVTQQLRLLERHLGTRLVRTDRRGVDLTATGAALATRLVRSFDDMRDALGDAAGLSGSAAPLTLALLATLAQRWLIPRLPSFQAAHPEIEVRLLTTSRLVDLQREDVDLAIRVGEGKWPGCRSDFLFENALFPVASPSLLERVPIGTPQDLARHVFISVDASPRHDDWPRWLTHAGLEGLKPQGRLTFASSAQALEAAAAGLGIAIAHTPFVESDLQTGRLVAPFDEQIIESESFYLVAPRAAATLPRVAAFRAWLLDAGPGA
ncbi:LysR substrate-binding domain-containing protein [Thalassospiraceae bacterium LMO-JJ14]|nr:LysR substrate-binding domain-containing protein [Thalassospiraceae bacterium LMO-JJ14]